MVDKNLVEYKSPITNLGPTAPFGGAASPILEGGIQHNLRDHLAIIFKHKYKIIALFFLALLLAPPAYFVVPKFRPPLYEAKSVLMVKSGREYNDPELGTRKTPISFGRGEIFTAEMLILKSRDLKQRILATVGLDKLYPNIVNHPPKNLPPQEAAILQLDKDLNVKEVRNSNFIEVSLLNREPEVSAKAVNLLVDYYVEKRRELLSDPKSIFFLEKKLAEYRQKLRESEERLESFRRNYGFYSFEKQMDFLQKKRIQLEETISTSQDESNTLKQTLATFNNRLKAPVDIPSRSAQTDDFGQETQEQKELRSKLLMLQMKEQELLGKYKETNGLVINVRREIHAMQDLQKKAEASKKPSRMDAPNPGSLVYQTMEQEKSATEANLKSAEAKVEASKTELKTLEKQITELGSQEKRLKELHREMEHNEQYYKTYASKVEELRIGEDITRQEMPSITVLQVAIPPAKPINENFHWLIYLAVAGGLGLGAGVGLAYLLEFMSQGLRTPEGVENRLGLPVLATVPYRTQG